MFSTAFELRGAGGSTIFFMRGKTFFEQRNFRKKTFLSLDELDEKFHHRPALFICPEISLALQGRSWICT
jgi:hypothetical protein